MESLIPTVTISLNTNEYEILELTVNPIFAIDTSFIKIYPERNFKVWIEVVLGHKSKTDLPIPEVHFSFNEAFHFTQDHHPPLDDRDLQASNKETVNFILYRHFWFNKIEDEQGQIYGETLDILKSAYGLGAIRFLPDEYRRYMNEKSKKEIENLISKFNNIRLVPGVRAALAFLRSNYIQKKISYKRINYPCTFNAKIVNQQRKIILTPRPFDLFDFGPMTSMIKLNKEESISFWYYYNYSEQTAAYADDKHKDLFSFLNRLVINSSIKNAEINYFPRLPFRYEVLNSEPPLGSSPRLPIDPPVWKCKEQLYPLRIIATKSKNRHWFKFTKNKSILDFFATIRDRKMENDKGLYIFILTLIGGITADILANNFVNIFASNGSRQIVKISFFIGGICLIIIIIIAFLIIKIIKYPFKPYRELCGSLIKKII